MRNYFESSKALGVCLKTGYVFRPKHPHRSHSVNKPVSSAVMNPRLEKHMRSMGIWEGKTLHGARHGVALTLQFLGVDQESTREHVG